MRADRPRLVACDLDGTILRSDGTISPRSAAALDRIADAGARFVFVTGRRPRHTEAVLVVFDPKVVSYDELLRAFWEGHDPTQGMRQGNDVGTQYRSGIYTYSDAQRDAAEASRAMFQERLTASGFQTITTEIVEAPTFFYAEDYHQQYLAKNPGGYCGLGGTGVSCPIGLARTD